MIMKKLTLALIFIPLLCFGSNNDVFNEKKIIVNEIEIENNSYDDVECAIVDELDQIITRVKVGSFKTVSVNLGYATSASDIRVFYKTSIDYDWKYQAYKENYSYPPKFVIE